MDTVNLVSDYVSLFALFARHFVAKLMVIPSNCTNFRICIFFYNINPGIILFDCSCLLSSFIFSVVLKSSQSLSVIR